MDKRDPVDSLSALLEEVPWDGFLKKLTCHGLRGKVRAPENLTDLKRNRGWE